MARLPILVTALSLALVSCSGAVAESTTTAPTAPATTSSPAPTTSTTVPAAAAIPEALGGFAVESIWLDDFELIVAVADTVDLRRQGLMNVEDLGGLDGMLFVFSDSTYGGFWMRDTLLDLDIAFFDDAGTYVDGFVMTPCTTSECPVYRPAGPYQYAVEVLAGTMPSGVQELRLGSK